MRSRAHGAQTIAHRASYNRDSVAKALTSNPLWANSRASESKASNSFECSAECSRESTQLKLVCEYRTAGLPVGSLSGGEGAEGEVEPLLAGEDE